MRIRVLPGPTGSAARMGVITRFITDTLPALKKRCLGGHWWQRVRSRPRPAHEVRHLHLRGKESPLGWWGLRSNGGAA